VVAVVIAGLDSWCYILVAGVAGGASFARICDFFQSFLCRCSPLHKAKFGEVASRPLSRGCQAVIKKFNVLLLEGQLG
jgi:hypothetical protein